jgi:hypothetical protein
VIAVKAAEALAQAGRSVTLLEQDGFAPEMGLPRRWRAADLLARLGVERIAAALEVAREAGGVRYRTPKREGEISCAVLLDARAHADEPGGGLRAWRPGTRSATAGGRSIWRRACSRPPAWLRRCDGGVRGT